MATSIATLISVVVAPVSRASCQTPLPVDPVSSARRTIKPGFVQIGSNEKVKARSPYLPASCLYNDREPFGSNLNCPAVYLVAVLAMTAHGSAANFEGLVGRGVLYQHPFRVEFPLNFGDRQDFVRY